MTVEAQDGPVTAEAPEPLLSEFAFSEHRPPDLPVWVRKEDR